MHFCLRWQGFRASSMAYRQLRHCFGTHVGMECERGSVSGVMGSLHQLARLSIVAGFSPACSCDVSILAPELVTSAGCVVVVGEAVAFASHASEAGTRRRALRCAAVHGRVRGARVGFLHVVGRIRSFAADPRRGHACRSFRSSAHRMLGEALMIVGAFHWPLAKATHLLVAPHFRDSMGERKT